ncbi:flagellar basal body rod protein [Bacillus pinisoli]|uniref:lmo0954 family membrane protein n=1 Tax=Bacillus pinisoli TaxID=2901866 RepID=UPI001FF0E0A0|nr:flagellar basal body rod protein [Bacillus pinisoli]
MKKFLLFIGGLTALAIVVANLGPMVLLGISVWLLYLIFKQFVKVDSTLMKCGWVIVGFVVLSIAVANIYAIIGVVAAYGLYLIVKEWKVKKVAQDEKNENDPFTNFEKQWAELTK